ncbi:MAG: DUF1801 domain-containing protein [Gemmatimonadota bacterium]|nr:DUF1801 domain-containing protein [Gemmatimonadota bacterium]
MSGMATVPEVDEVFLNATRWLQEAEALRQILLDCDLTEALKWGKPCYAHDGKNICIIQSMKDFLALLFFKGALLKDPDGLLERQGPNSRSGFRMRFTSVQEVARMAKSIKAFVNEAIEVERAGLKVERATKFDYPEELLDRFVDDPDFKTAFDRLTPGRQRGYVLHFSGARLSKTRAARIERYRRKILDGKGFHDR